MIKQVCSFITMLIVLIGSILPGFAVAECVTCTKSPSELDKYFRVMEELLDHVDISMDPEAGQFDGLKVAVEAGLDLARNAYFLDSVLTTQVGGDMFGTIRTLHRSDSLRRDRDKLIDIDRQIVRRALDMSSAQRHNDTIPVEVLTQIDMTLQKLAYVKLAKTSDGTYFMEINNATYTEYIDLLRKLNRFYKILHQRKWYDSDLDQVGMGYWAVDGSDEEEALRKADQEALMIFIDEIIDLENKVFHFCRRTVSISQSDQCTPVTVLDFATNSEEQSMKALLVHIWEIQDDYSCSTGLASECHEWSNIREQSQEFFSQRVITDVNASLNEFKDAWSRLIGLLHGPDSDDYQNTQARKEALLTDYWGPTWSKDGAEGRFITRTQIEESPQSAQSLWRSLEKVRQKRDSDLISKSAERPIFNSQLSDRAVDKFWFVRGKYAQEPSTNDRPERQGDELMYSTKEAKEAEIDMILPDAWKNQEFKRDGETVDQRSRVQTQVLNNKVASFQDSFQQVLALQDEMVVASVFTDVNRVTHMFPELSASVYQNMEIIGKKNTKGKLYHAMGNVCDLQCTNLGTNCRYYAE